MKTAIEHHTLFFFQHFPKMEYNYNEPHKITEKKKKKILSQTSVRTSAELIPVSSFNSLMAANLGSSLSSIPPCFTDCLKHFQHLV